MKARHSSSARSANAPARGEDFSLVLGGPLYQMLLRLRMLQPPLGLLYRRLIVIPVLAWMPLLVLSLLDGRATGGVAIPFLFDISAYARFLVAMPILILAEPFVHYRLRDVVRQFDERRVIPPAITRDFDHVVASAMKLRNSVAAEITILVLAFVVGPLSIQPGLPAMQTSAWQGDAEAGQLQLTRAGWWFVHVSAPMFQFLLLRWYFRLLVWWRLLWQLSRLPLDLKAAHPDRAGGIGFLGDSVSGLVLVLFGQGVFVSGVIANRVLAGMREASDLLPEIVGVVILMVLFMVGPLLFFSPQLTAARRQGLRRYGALSSKYVDEFEDKWIHGKPPAGEALMGSADIQSLADLAGSSDIVKEMRPVPFDMRVLIQLGAATAAPFLPLVLTEIPFREVLSRVLQMMF